MTGPGPVLHYRAGPEAHARLAEHGLVPDAIGAVVGPASGPKWLVLAGLDAALVDTGLLFGGRRRRLLVGASAGAWRMLALASRDPLSTHRALRDSYIGDVFPRGVTVAEVTEVYRRKLRTLIPAEDVAHILDHPRADVAVHTVRVRRGLPLRPKPAYLSWLAAAAAANAVAGGRLAPRALSAFVERVVFHTVPESFAGRVDGRLERLGAVGFHDIAQASGTVPTALDPVRSPHGAPAGVYLDGGVTDYHLATRYLADDDDRVVLLPHYQERIAGAWFDKHLRRRTGADFLRDVLQIYPDPAWIASLPGGRIPDRRDFHELVDDPEERQRRWRGAADRSDELGAALRDDLDSGRWWDALESF